MRSSTANIIEETANRLAAGLLGAAVGYAGWAVGSGRTDDAGMLAIWAAIAGLTYIFALKKLGDFGQRPAFSVPRFEPAALELAALEELVLTAADRLEPEAEVAAEPLVLDDVLARLDPDSRVVQLFDSKRMPTPGDLDTRIRRHLRARERNSAGPDASDALHQALSELRTQLG